jgi:putative addiction module component (TIGR02574 family)
MTEWLSGFFIGCIMEFQAVVDAVRKLPVDDQARLLDLIQDELDSHELDLTPEQLAELDRRLEDIEKNPGRGVPWEGVLAAARARHQK